MSTTSLNQVPSGIPLPPDHDLQLGVAVLRNRIDEQQVEIDLWKREAQHLTRKIKQYEHALIRRSTTAETVDPAETDSPGLELMARELRDLRKAVSGLQDQLASRDANPKLSSEPKKTAKLPARRRWLESTLQPQTLNVQASQRGSSPGLDKCQGHTAIRFDDNVQLQDQVVPRFGRLKQSVIPVQHAPPVDQNNQSGSAPTTNTNAGGARNVELAILGWKNLANSYGHSSAPELPMPVQPQHDTQGTSGSFVPTIDQYQQYLASLEAKLDMLAEEERRINCGRNPNRVARQLSLYREKRTIKEKIRILRGKVAQAAAAAETTSHPQLQVAPP